VIKQLKIITRKEAIEKNLKKYFTGKHCMRGHLSERNVYNHTCMECQKRDKKEYKKRNVEKIRKAGREYYHNNKEKSAEYARKNREKINLRKQKWREDNKDKSKAYMKEYKKQYVIKNREKIRVEKNEYIKKRRANDSGFKTQIILRTRMRQLINSGKMKKHKTSITEFAKFVVGLTQKEFLDYIEAQFYPHPITGKKMTWKNQGHRGWHLDHIKPVSKFDLTKWEEQLKCFHYSNIQPLWAEDNLKKSDKY